MDNRIDMVNVDKSFGGVSVLSNVGFSIQPGEVVALLGANGAGKSTLMKILTGVYSRDAGSIKVEGVEVRMSNPREAAALGISFLPQEISVMPDMTVAENICLANMDQFGRGAFVDRAAMRAKATKILGQVGFDHVSPDSYVGHLSVAEQRIVEIARALASDANVLVMDEPTAALSERDAQAMFEVLRNLREDGTSVVYISHYLGEVFEISDRIEVLRDGRNAGSFHTAETDVESVLAAMLGRAAETLFDHRQAPSGGEAAFEAAALGWKDKLSDVSFTVSTGEIFGIFGLVGSGVEYLGRVVFGAEGRNVRGDMRLMGSPYRAISPAHGKACGLGYVTAERKADGILGDLSVAQNLASAFWPEYRNGPFASRHAEAALAQKWIKGFDIRTSGPDQPVRLLSGGNQQKVCVARWLHEGVRLLILEEPTRGVDMGARRDIYRQLAEFAAQGLTVLVLSSDAEEIAGLCDRSLVLNRGRVVQRFGRGADASALLAATALTDPAEVEKELT
ncbi:sugar ABC transporter ATP-binding protein [Nitratireductor sp. XY-223]|uniref:sugar ABC transporter ATP-binding protein n=1 Tax=Nitratireductor sp. XY-223 TaxID=2561926 RepID=UPI001FEEB159|nr:sugar ABC transporter ATP-binding protein [Nitratireductor sp. XY-223]